MTTGTLDWVLCGYSAPPGTVLHSVYGWGDAFVVRSARRPAPQPALCLPRAGADHLPALGRRVAVWNVEKSRPGRMLRRIPNFVGTWHAGRDAAAAGSHGVARSRRGTGDREGFGALRGVS